MTLKHLSEVTNSLTPILKYYSVNKNKKTKRKSNPKHRNKTKRRNKTKHRNKTKCRNKTNYRVVNYANN